MPEPGSILTDEQAAYVQGLHDLADFLATRPDLIPPGCAWNGVVVYRYVGSGDDMTETTRVKTRFAMLAGQLGTAAKKADDQYFDLDRMFGPHKLQVTAKRDLVCERVVVGTETVEVTEPDPEQVAALPTVTRTEIRELVEYRCPDSILRAALGEESTAA